MAEYKSLDDFKSDKNKEGDTIFPPELLEARDKFLEALEKYSRNGQKNRGFIFLYDKETQDLAGFGCIGCAVEAFSEWTFRAMHDGHLKHDRIELGDNSTKH